jgi:hypothetical protein
MVNAVVITSVQLAILGAAPSAESKQVGSDRRPDSSYLSLEASSGGNRSRVDIYGTNFVFRPSPEDPTDDSHEGGMFWIERHSGFHRIANIGIIVSEPGTSQWVFLDLSCSRRDLDGDIHSDTCNRAKPKVQFTSIVSKSRGVLLFTGYCGLTKSRLCTYVLVSERGIQHP